MSGALITQFCGFVSTRLLQRRKKTYPTNDLATFPTFVNHVSRTRAYFTARHAIDSRLVAIESRPLLQARGKS